MDSGPGGGPVIPVSDDLRAATLSAGGNHTCVIRSDRSLWCWGDDSMGELGDGVNPARGTPEPVGNATDWVSIAAGDYYSTFGCLPPVGYPEPSPCGSGTCGIRADGTLWCWGDVATPLTNTNIRANGPTRIGDASDWNRVSTSGRQACGIRLNGTLWCWGGVNISGFGLAESAGTADPEQVGAAADWRDVNVGKGASCGIRRDGTLWCWASSPYETFGAVVIPPPHPQRIGSGVDWISASVGGSNRKACGIRADQSLWCWNWTARQEANRGPPIFATDPELRVGGISNYAAVSVGDALSCAIRSDGALFCWSEGLISPEVQWRLSPSG
jgi:alpha-tubulin suppressor-like RCC1 family protein